jgi:UDPglucose 6-dehydrogenase
MRVSVIGTGYVGLVTGTCFAETGVHVTCVDIDKNKIEKLKSRVIPIYEPGLEPMFERNIREGRLEFTTSLEEGTNNSNVIFLALPTPPDEDGSADLKYVLQVAGQLGPILKSYTVIVDKSTVPVGTAEKVRQRIAASCKVDFDVVSNPEFLREGVAVEDFMKPDRVVIGTTSERAIKIMKDLFSPLVRQGNPILFMDERSAELTKYAANAFLATKITFMNEIANLCELLGADVEEVRKGIGTDSRIGKRFLFAGIGYGGSCFPKDVQALAKSADENQYDFKILKSVMSVNQAQKIKLARRIYDFFDNDLHDRTIAVWGLSFKPYTDDIREAPSIYNIEELLRQGARIKAYDPEAMENARSVLHNKIILGKDEYDVLIDADALLIITEWPVFRTPDFTLMASKMKNKVIFDGRNLYDPNSMKDLDFTYISIGRREVYA